MSFRGTCSIGSVGFDGNGQIAAFLKAEDGSFDYTSFYPPDGRQREFLAIALAAITSDRLIDIASDTTSDGSKVSWFFIGS